MLFNSVWCKTMENKLTGIVLNLILIGILVIIALILYWSLRPYNVIEYQVDYFEMQKDEYVVGEPLTYRIAFCKKGNYTGTVIRTLHDGIIYIFPEIISKSPQGCIDQISTTTVVPNVPTGEYVYEDTVIYQVNPIREISYTMKSTPFKIVNND